MKDDNEIDEVAANVLLLNGIDSPTAVAGSIKEPRSDENVSKFASAVGVVAALIVALFFLYIWTHL